MAHSLSSPNTNQLDITLFPHRSLKPEHFSKLLLVLIVVCTLASIRFTLVGAWPVAAFLFIDLLALWFAFYLNYRRARVREEVVLTDTLLTVRRTLPNGSVESWVFEPYWVTLRLVKDSRYKNRLEVTLHGQSVLLGSFLTPNERKELHAALTEAIQKWKNRGFIQAE